MSDDVPEDGPPNKRLWNFKEFFTRTPCVRTSMMYGISGGLAFGAATFLYSKHIQRSCDVAVLSFALVGLGSFQYCSQQLREERKAVREAVKILERSKLPKLPKENVEVTET